MLLSGHRLVAVHLSCPLKNLPAKVLVCVLFLGTSCTAQGQVASGISGTVISQDGLPITGAIVAVRSDATGVENRSATGPEGYFGLIGLLPGVYTITASANGFTTKVLAGLDLTLNQKLHLDITLRVIGAKETIRSVESPPLIESEISSSGSTILPGQVESMPLNGRDYLDLLQLVPGVSINRNYSEGNDQSAPILGERANDAY